MDTYKMKDLVEVTDSVKIVRQEDAYPYERIRVAVIDHPAFYSSPAHYQLAVENALEDMGFTVVEQVSEWLFNPNTTAQTTTFIVECAGQRRPEMDKKVEELVKDIKREKWDALYRLSVDGSGFVTEQECRRLEEKGWAFCGEVGWDITEAGMTELFKALGSGDYNPYE